MSVDLILILLGSIVIVSYLADMIALKTRLPSVLTLLSLGIIIKFIFDYFDITTINFLGILPTIGTIGLVLIVFEEALELEFKKEKLKLIKLAFISAFSSLLGTSIIIMFILHAVTDYSYHICLINAIPLSIISSAIAIPSAVGFRTFKREFIVYESSLSDILGIIFFNFVLKNPEMYASSFVILGGKIIFTIIISIIICVALFYLIRRINHKIKFFLILSILLLFYGISKHFDWASLVIVITFGFFLNNVEKINIKKFRKIFLYPHYKEDLKQFHQLSAESAFILRTFFFVMFGFIIDFEAMKNFEVFLYGLLIILIIYVIRFLIIKSIAKSNSLNDLVFMAPRGLISILLFFYIPAELKIENFELGILFLVVILSSIIMLISLMSGKKKILPPRDPQQS